MSYDVTSMTQILCIMVSSIVRHHNCISGSLLRAPSQCKICYWTLKWNCFRSYFAASERNRQSGVAPQGHLALPNMFMIGQDINYSRSILSSSEERFSTSRRGGRSFTSLLIIRSLILSSIGGSAAKRAARPPAVAF